MTLHVLYARFGASMLYCFHQLPYVCSRPIHDAHAETLKQYAC